MLPTESIVDRFVAISEMLRISGRLAFARSNGRVSADMSLPEHCG